MKPLKLFFSCLGTILLCSCISQSTTSVSVEIANLQRFQSLKYFPTLDFDKHIGIDSYDYQIYEGVTRNETFVLFHPEKEKLSLILVSIKKMNYIVLEHSRFCNGLLLLNTPKGTLLIMLTNNKYREPLVELISISDDSSLKLLETIGGEEWRTGNDVNIEISENKLTIIGLSPERYSLNEKSKIFLDEIGLKIGFNKGRKSIQINPQLFYGKLND